MNKLNLIAAAGVATLMVAGAAAAPAMAQSYGYSQSAYGYDHRDGREYRDGRDYRDGREYRDDRQAYAGRTLTSGYVDSLEWRIDHAVQQGRLSNWQARRLVADLRQIQGPTIYRVETGRANGWEVRRVQDTVARIEAATRGYAQNDRRDRYGRRY